MKLAPPGGPARIAVVGGGPAGLACALRLARSGQRVLLLDRPERADSRPGEHLAAEGVRELEALELGFVLAQLGTRSPGTRSAWEDGTLTADSDLYRPFGPSCLVQRAALTQLLRSALERLDVPLIAEPLQRAELRTHDLCLTLVSGRKLEVAFLLDASGRSAHAARKLGATMLRCDALVACALRFAAASDTAASAPQDRSPLVESAPDGWWYSVPLADGCLLAVYFSDADQLPPRELAVVVDAALAASPHTAARVKAYGALVSRSVRPACSQRLAQITGERWLALGDAAMAWDPLSSSGLTNALLDAREAADALALALRSEPLALAQHAARAKRRFAEFLATRARYYRRVERYATRPFWQRRRQAVALEQPLGLHPHSRLERTQTEFALGQLAPGLAADTVLGVVSSGLPAFEAVARLARLTRGAYLDEELIFALEQLLAHGALRAL